MPKANDGTWAGLALGLYPGHEFGVTDGQAKPLTRDSVPEARARHPDVERKRTARHQKFPFTDVVNEWGRLWTPKDRDAFTAKAAERGEEYEHFTRVQNVKVALGNCAAPIGWHGEWPRPEGKAQNVAKHCEFYLNVLTCAVWIQASYEQPGARARLTLARRLFRCTELTLNELHFMAKGSWNCLRAIEGIVGLSATNESNGENREVQFRVPWTLDEHFNSAAPDEMKAQRGLRAAFGSFMLYLALRQYGVTQLALQLCPQVVSVRKDTGAQVTCDRLFVSVGNTKYCFRCATTANKANKSKAKSQVVAKRRRAWQAAPTWDGKRRLALSWFDDTPEVQSALQAVRTALGKKANQVSYAKFQRLYREKLRGRT